MSGKIIKVFTLFVLSFLFFTCDPYPDFPAGKVTGYRPIYHSSVSAAISFTTPKPVSKPGKIYIHGKYLLINEKQGGIHVFDNENPAEPKAVGFLSIYGNTDMAIKNSVLYVDHYGSLVALNINDLSNIQELSRIQTGAANLPPETGHYFECIDPAKGEVIGWELVMLNNPECYK